MESIRLRFYRASTGGRFVLVRVFKGAANAVISMHKADKTRRRSV